MMVTELTPSQKGPAAEAEIAAAAIRLRLQVLLPVGEGGRYDLAIDVGESCSGFNASGLRELEMC